MMEKNISCRQTERNKDIWRRHHNLGESFRIIAEHYDISAARAYQIYWNVDKQIDRLLKITNSPVTNPYAYDNWFTFGPGGRRLFNPWSQWSKNR